MRKEIDGKLISEDELVKTHDKLVHYTIKKYGYTRLLIEYEDLVSIGMIGLIKAFRDYDKSRGTKFSTYAIIKIRGEILRNIRDYHQDSGPKFSRDSKRLAAMILRNNLEECSVQEVSESLKISVKEAKSGLECVIHSTPVSLEHEITNSTNKIITIHDVIGYEDNYFLLELHDFIKNLTNLEQQVVLLRIKDFTQTEIGNRLGYSQVYISRLLAKIKAKYRTWSGKDATVLSATQAS